MPNFGMPNALQKRSDICTRPRLGLHAANARPTAPLQPVKLSRCRATASTRSCSSHAPHVTTSDAATPAPRDIDRRQAAVLAAVLLSSAASAHAKKPRTGLELTSAEVAQLSEADWKQRLRPEQYRVLRKGGTEPPFSSGLHKLYKTGVYRCAGCGNEVFPSSTKFNSGTGWPSFWDPVKGGVSLKADDSIPFFPRTEVSCSRCHGHLGHVFKDGPEPTGMRYCMNGAAMIFSPSNEAPTA